MQKLTKWGYVLPIWQYYAMRIFEKVARVESLCEAPVFLTNGNGRWRGCHGMRQSWKSNIRYLKKPGKYEWAINHSKLLGIPNGLPGKFRGYRFEYDVFFWGQWIDSTVGMVTTLTFLKKRHDIHNGQPDLPPYLISFYFLKPLWIFFKKVKWSSEKSNVFKSRSTLASHSVLKKNYISETHTKKPLE